MVDTLNPTALQSAGALRAHAKLPCCPRAYGSFPSETAITFKAASPSTAQTGS